MTTPENLPRFDKPEPKAKAVAPTPPANPLPRFDKPAKAGSTRSPQAVADGYNDLHASRVALLDGRECKLAAAGAVNGSHAIEQDGHVARMWHICPGCFPQA